MTKFSIASETLLEICEQARKEIERRKSQRPPGMVLHYEMQSYFPEEAEAKIFALESTAKRAIKLAGQGQSHVIIDQLDEMLLQDVLPTRK
jgi:hypothetical protein